MGVDMFEQCEVKFDDVQENFLSRIMDKSIMEEEKWVTFALSLYDFVDFFALMTACLLKMHCSSQLIFSEKGFGFIYVTLFTLGQLSSCVHPAVCPSVRPSVHHSRSWAKVYLLSTIYMSNHWYWRTDLRAYKYFYNSIIFWVENSFFYQKWKKTMSWSFFLRSRNIFLGKY